MALFINNQCLTDPVTALQQATLDFPQFNVSVNAGNSVNLDRYISASSINMTTGVLTYSTKNAQNVVLTTNSTVTFPQCTVPSLILDYTSANAYIVLAIAVASCLGFMTAFGISNSGGRS